MACDCQFVATDVGDVRWLLDNVSKSVVCERRNEDVVRAVLQMPVTVLDRRASEINHV